MDDAFIDKLYADMTSLYRLDQLENGQGESAVGAELGPLPAASAALLCTLAAVWIALVSYVIADALKKKRSR